MDRMLYVAMSGAKQTLLAQAAATHNLANATTTGFRADLSAFRAMPVFGPGEPSRVYAMAERPGVEFRSGSLQATNNDLDVAIDGNGFIAVQSPDGTEAYTRAGDLRINSFGMLETAEGHPVLGNSGPIAVPPSEKLEIAQDGTISVRPVGQGPNALVTLDRIRLVKPEHSTLIKDANGLFRVADGTAAPPDASVTLVQGALESSNVNTVDAMVTMINLQRQFDLQVKAMHTAQENAAAATQILRLA